VDAQYDAMKASGKPFDPDAYEGRDWNPVRGDLDRRSLYAISSNTGGLFSEEEQTRARDMMLQQQSLATGLYTGPTRLEDTHVNPYQGDRAGQAKASIKFLDQVSDEEKASLNWSMDRASAQTAFEAAHRNTRKELEELEKLNNETPLARLIKAATDSMKKKSARGDSSTGEEPENLDSESPLARLVKSAMDTMQNNQSRGISHGQLRTVEDLKEQPWFKGFESQLDSAIEQTKAMYLKEKTTEKA